VASLSKENLAVLLLFVPVGIAVNAVFLWGVRDIVDLTNPLFWVFGIAFNVWLHKLGKRAEWSHTRKPAGPSR